MSDKAESVWQSLQKEYGDDWQSKINELESQELAGGSKELLSKVVESIKKIDKAAGVSSLIEDAAKTAGEVKELGKAGNEKFKKFLKDSTGLSDKEIAIAISFGNSIGWASVPATGMYIPGLGMTASGITALAMKFGKSLFIKPKELSTGSNDPISNYEEIQKYQEGAVEDMTEKKRELAERERIEKEEEQGKKRERIAYSPERMEVLTRVMKEIPELDDLYSEIVIDEEAFEIFSGSVYSWDKKGRERGIDPVKKVKSNFRLKAKSKEADEEKKSSAEFAVKEAIDFESRAKTQKEKEEAAKKTEEKKAKASKEAQKIRVKRGISEEEEASAAAPSVEPEEILKRPEEILERPDKDLNVVLADRKLFEQQEEAIFRMRDGIGLDKMSNKEIAESLNLSPGRISQIYGKAKSKIGEIYKTPEEFKAALKFALPVKEVLEQEGDFPAHLLEDLGPSDVQYFATGTNDPVKRTKPVSKIIDNRTGKPITGTHFTQLGEYLFKNLVASDLAKVLGSSGKVEHLSEIDPQAPLDFLVGDSTGVEHKIVGGESAQRAAMSKEEVKRKIEEARRMKLGRTATVIQSFDQKKGMLSVFANIGKEGDLASGIKSRRIPKTPDKSSMVHIGDYDVKEKVDQWFVDNPLESEQFGLFEQEGIPFAEGGSISGMRIGEDVHPLSIQTFAGGSDDSIEAKEKKFEIGDRVVRRSESYGFREGVVIEIPSDFMESIPEDHRALYKNKICVRMDGDREDDGSFWSPEDLEKYTEWANKEQKLAKGSRRRLVKSSTPDSLYDMMDDDIPFAEREEDDAKEGVDFELIPDSELGENFDEDSQGFVKGGNVHPLKLRTEGNEESIEQFLGSKVSNDGIPIPVFAIGGPVRDRPGSQVQTDENKPQPVFHGSFASFEDFDISKAANVNKFGGGHYFTESEEHATDFVSRGETKGEVHKVYLDARNPYKSGYALWPSDEAEKSDYANAYNTVLKMKQEAVVSGDTDKLNVLNNILKQHKESGDNSGAYFGMHDLGGKYSPEILQRAGYDSVTAGQGTSRTWVVWNDEQIKHAKDVDVNSEEFKEWFGTSGKISQDKETRQKILDARAARWYEKVKSKKEKVKSTEQKLKTPPKNRTLEEILSTDPEILREEDLKRRAEDDNFDFGAEYAQGSISGMKAEAPTYITPDILLPGEEGFNKRKFDYNAPKTHNLKDPLSMREILSPEDVIYPLLKEADSSEVPLWENVANKIVNAPFVGIEQLLKAGAYGLHGTSKLYNKATTGKWAEGGFVFGTAISTQRFGKGSRRKLKKSSTPDSLYDMMDDDIPFAEEDVNYELIEEDILNPSLLEGETDWGEGLLDEHLKGLSKEDLSLVEEATKEKKSPAALAAEKILREYYRKDISLKDFRLADGTNDPLEKTMLAQFPNRGDVNPEILAKIVGGRLQAKWRGELDRIDDPQRKKKAARKFNTLDLVQKALREEPFYAEGEDVERIGKMADSFSIGPYKQAFSLAYAKMKKMAEEGQTGFAAGGLCYSNSIGTHQNFAKGGVVPGDGNTDSVKMMLPEGSFVSNVPATEMMGEHFGSAIQLETGGDIPVKVMPKERIWTPQEVDQIGLGTLQAYNQLGRQNLAEGGNVGGGKPPSDPPKTTFDDSNDEFWDGRPWELAQGDYLSESGKKSLLPTQADLRREQEKQKQEELNEQTRKEFAAGGKEKLPVLLDEDSYFSKEQWIKHQGSKLSQLTPEEIEAKYGEYKNTQEEKERKKQWEKTREPDKVLPEEIKTPEWYMEPLSPSDLKKKNILDAQRKKRKPKEEEKKTYDVVGEEEYSESSSGYAPLPEDFDTAEEYVKDLVETNKAQKFLPEEEFRKTNKQRFAGKSEEEMQKAYYAEIEKIKQIRSQFADTREKFGLETEQEESNLPSQIRELNPRLRIKEGSDEQSDILQRLREAKYRLGSTSREEKPKEHQERTQEVAELENAYAISEEQHRRRSEKAAQPFRGEIETEKAATTRQERDFVSTAAGFGKELDLAKSTSQKESDDLLIKSKKDLAKAYTDRAQIETDKGKESAAASALATKESELTEAQKEKQKQGAKVDYLQQGPGVDASKEGPGVETGKVVQRNIQKTKIEGETLKTTAEIEEGKVKKEFSESPENVALLEKKLNYKRLLLEIEVREEAIMASSTAKYTDSPEFLDLLQRKLALKRQLAETEFKEKLLTSQQEKDFIFSPQGQKREARLSRMGFDQQSADWGKLAEQTRIHRGVTGTEGLFRQAVIPAITSPWQTLRRPMQFLQGQGEKVAGRMQQNQIYRLMGAAQPNEFEEKKKRREMAFGGDQARYGTFIASIKEAGKDLEEFGSKAARVFGYATAGILGLISAASPDAFNTIMMQFKILAATIGYDLIPHVLKVSGLISKLTFEYMKINPVLKENIIHWAGIGLKALGVATAFGKAWSILSIPFKHPFASLIYGSLLVLDKLGLLEKSIKGIGTALQWIHGKFGDLGTIAAASLAPLALTGIMAAGRRGGGALLGMGLSYLDVGFGARGIGGLGGNELSSNSMGAITGIRGAGRGRFARGLYGVGGIAGVAAMGYGVSQMATAETSNDSIGGGAATVGGAMMAGAMIPSAASPFLLAGGAVITVLGVLGQKLGWFGETVDQTRNRLNALGGGAGGAMAEQETVFDFIHGLQSLPGLRQAGREGQVNVPLERQQKQLRRQFEQLFDTTNLPPAEAQRIRTFRSDLENATSPERRSQILQERLDELRIREEGERGAQGKVAGISERLGRITEPGALNPAALGLSDVTSSELSRDIRYVASRFNAGAAGPDIQFEMRTRRPFNVNYQNQAMSQGRALADIIRGGSQELTPAQRRGGIVSPETLAAAQRYTGPGVAKPVNLFTNADPALEGAVGRIGGDIRRNLLARVLAGVSSTQLQNQNQIMAVQGMQQNVVPGPNGLLEVEQKNPFAGAANNAEGQFGELRRNMTSWMSSPTWREDPPKRRQEVAAYYEGQLGRLEKAVPEANRNEEQKTAIASLREQINVIRTGQATVLQAALTPEQFAHRQIFGEGFVPNKQNAINRLVGGENGVGFISVNFRSQQLSADSLHDLVQMEAVRTPADQALFEITSASFKRLIELAGAGNGITEDMLKALDRFTDRMGIQD